MVPIWLSQTRRLDRDRPCCAGRLEALDKHNRCLDCLAYMHCGSEDMYTQDLRVQPPHAVVVSRCNVAGVSI